MKNIICLGLLLLFGAWLPAQEDLPTGQVDVVKSFEARLADAERIEIRPEMPPLDTNTRRLQYEVVAKPIPVEYLPPKIRPLAFRTEKPPTAYDGYARFGGGVPNAFYGEVSYDITKNEEFDFGIDLMRYTINNGNKVENQRLSDNHLGLDGTYYLEQGFAINGTIDYTNKGVYYYGYNEINEELDTMLHTFTDDQVLQRYSIFDFGVDLFNGERTVGDFNYRAGIDLYLMNDNYAARENAFLLTLEGTKWFDERHPLTVRLLTDFSTFKDTMKQTLNNFYLQPSYTYHADQFQVKVGLNVTSNDDNYAVFPDLEASANIIPGLVTAFVGATGSLYKNSFRNLADYNPFIRTRLRLRNSRYNEFYGGVKGNVIGATYQAQIGYRKVNNLALFRLLDPFEAIPRFDVLYDTASILTVKGTLVFPLFEGLELTGSVSQNIYTLDREEKPWHLPATTIDASARYLTPDNQFAFRADLFLQNGVPYLDTDGEAKNLNALFDVSVMGEYFFSDSFGAFIQLNNLAGNQRQRWFRYRTVGLNVLLGLSARF